MRCPSFQRPSRGFTLIELLLVIAILGIMTAVTLPRFSRAMSGGRISVATRLLARTGRYARTMALLHQAPVDLVVRFDPPVLRVEAASRERPAEESSFPEDADAPRLEPEAEAPLPAPDPLSMARENFGETIEPTDTTEAFSDAVAVEHPLEKVTVEFLGYTDTVEPFSGDPEAEEVRIRYRSNGACRPHRWRIVDEQGVAREIAVDIVGSFEIDDPEGGAP